MPRNRTQKAVLDHVNREWPARVPVADLARKYDGAEEAISTLRQEGLIRDAPGWPTSVWPSATGLAQGRATPPPVEQ